MKKCSKCGVERDKPEFRKDKYRPDGLTIQCKSCHREYEARTREQRLIRGKKWRDANKERMKECSDRWYQENKERKAETQFAWREANKERDRQNKKNYYENNRGKFRTRDRKRMDIMANATPKWVNWKYVELWYELARKEEDRTGRKVHVDHIIPLNNPLVCGLHCEDNMQLLFAEDNLKKSNKFDPETYYTV